MEPDYDDISFSKNVRLSSNLGDMNPQYLLKKARLNKINHHNYNPVVQNCEWKKHYKEIISKHNSLSPPNQQIDFENEFLIK